MARHAYPPLDNLSPRLAEELRKRIAPDRGNVWKMLMWSPGRISTGMVAFTTSWARAGAAPAPSKNRPERNATGIIKDAGRRRWNRRRRSRLMANNPG